MTEEATPKDMADQPVTVTWREFLQEYPLYSEARVRGAAHQQGSRSYILFAPELQLQCSRENCTGNRSLHSICATPTLRVGSWQDAHLKYICRDCCRMEKTFAVRVRLVDHSEEIYQAYKFGEYPPFVSPVPASVLRLIRPDSELFLCGRRCENQGLGIGAHTYYRRIVQNQWGRLLDEIIKAAISINADKSVVQALKAARKQRQFSKAVKDTKGIIPASLLVDGDNPLPLLYRALSLGVQQLGDAECLERARAVRLVLMSLADNLNHVLRRKRKSKRR